MGWMLAVDVWDFCREKLTIVEGLMSSQGSGSEYEVFGSWYADETREALSSTGSGNYPQFRFR
jgi:hypothetical protein